jgi:hypothetical protein
VLTVPEISTTDSLVALKASLKYLLSSFTTTWTKPYLSATSKNNKEPSLRFFFIHPLIVTCWLIL